MLRRRKRDQRKPRPAVAPAQPAATPLARRRPREGAPVPDCLRLDARRAGHSRADKLPPKATQVILVTGFDPFGGESLNPSWEICRQLDGKLLGGARVVACKAPCEFRRAIEVVAAAIREHRPRVVVSIGQAGGRAHMSVERVAINVDDARIADNGGERPIDEPIAPHGPAAYFATVPVKAMVAAMRGAGVPAMVSNSAGTYVCNHLMYGVLHFIAASALDCRAGFIHVPYAEQQVLDKPAMPALALATMVRGLEAALEAAITHDHDIKASEGALD